MVAAETAKCQCDVHTPEAKLIDWLLTGVLCVHLLAMNVASAGPLIGMWLWGKDKSRLPRQQPTGRALASFSIWALLSGILLGGVLWFATHSAGLGAAVARLPVRALWFAAVELVFSLVCMLGCLWCWNAERNRRWLHAFLAILTSTNLLYHFPPFMGVIGRVASDPAWARAAVLDRPELLNLMKRTEIVALSMHFVLASIAVSAVAALWILSRDANDLWKSNALPLARGNAWIALITTALQLPVGIWLMVSLPKHELAAMMGAHLTASLGLLAAMLLTFVLLQRLLGIAIGDPSPPDLRGVTWVLAMLVLLMTATLKATRESAAESPTTRIPTKSALERFAKIASPQGCWVSKLQK